MTLFEINASIENAIETMFANVDQETGEVLSEDVEMLDQLNAAKEDKIDNIACYIKNLEAEAEAIKNEAKKLNQRAKVAQNKADRLKSYLEVNLNEEKFKSPRVAISFRKSKQVVVYNEDDLPKMYQRIKAEPDKVAIKEAILNGKKVKGADIVEKTNMVIK